MLKKILTENRMFFIPLIRKLTLVLTSKVIITIKNFYFSTPNLFDENHIFGGVKSNTVLYR